MATPGWQLFCRQISQFVFEYLGLIITLFAIGEKFQLPLFTRMCHCVAREPEVHPLQKRLLSFRKLVYSSKCT